MENDQKYQIEFLELMNKKGSLSKLYRLALQCNVDGLKERVREKKYRKCVLAISGDNFKLHHPRIFFPHMTEKEHLEEELKAKGKMLAVKHFIDQHFEECLIFVGDELVRIGLMIQFGMSEAEGIEGGKTLLSGFRSFAKDIFALDQQEGDTRYHLVGDAQMRQWKPEQSPDFGFYLSLYEKLSQSRGDFHQEIIEPFVAAYTNRHVNNVVSDVSPLLSTLRIADLSRRYLLEELAICSLFWDRGYAVTLYPGPLFFLDLMSTCQEPGIPEHWEEVGVIQTVLKRVAREWAKAS